MFGVICMFSGCCARKNIRNQKLKKKLKQLSCSVRWPYWWPLNILIFGTYTIWFTLLGDIVIVILASLSNFNIDYMCKLWCKLWHLWWRVLEKKIFKDIHPIFIFSWQAPLRIKGFRFCPLLNNLEFICNKDILFQERH